MHRGQSQIPGHSPEHLRALLRHFADLRDGSHGGQTTRLGKEELFARAVALLDPYAKLALEEVNERLLLGSGAVSATGVVSAADQGKRALWTLSWPEQNAAGISPITLRADYGSAFHHPHLQGATVGVWPMNVFTKADAEGALGILRAIATADLHNLVYQRDYRVVPATTRVSATP